MNGTAYVGIIPAPSTFAWWRSASEAEGPRPRRRCCCASESMLSRAGWSLRGPWRGSRPTGQCHESASAGDDRDRVAARRTGLSFGVFNKSSCDRGRRGRTRRGLANHIKMPDSIIY
jgi:hypothetical protein